jgi:hypothetical protein
MQGNYGKNDDDENGHKRNVVQVVEQGNFIG